jgi:hypothetical protein
MFYGVNSHYALVEIAAGIEPVQDGRIYIELVNAGFMRQHGGSGPEFGTGIRFAKATWPVTQSTVSDRPDQYAGPSQLERTIVAVDCFINRRISGAWESVCRSALGYTRQQQPPEEDYGGGDICSLEGTGSTEDGRPLE